MDKDIVIGTRGSDLALWQAGFVKDRLASLFPELRFEIRVITTTGDRLVDVALSKIGDKGLFTRQIETELLDGGIDLAVHSLKDLQTSQPGGLTLGAVCEREVPNDVLISKNSLEMDRLPEGARVATGSLRRRSQLLHHRPDLRIEEIRGNVPTRLRKFDESGLDAMVLAYAGLQRLGFGDRITQLVPFDIMLPAVGQGAVAVEIRDNDERLATVARRIDHPPTRICVTAERAFLRTLEGGCQVPIGAHARLDSDNILLEGMVGSLDGQTVFRDSIEGTSGEAESLGVRLAETLIARGAARLLDEAREAAAAAPTPVI